MKNGTSALVFLGKLLLERRNHELLISLSLWGVFFVSDVFSLVSVSIFNE